MTDLQNLWGNNKKSLNLVDFCDLLWSKYWRWYDFWWNCLYLFMLTKSEQRYDWFVYFICKFRGVSLLIATTRASFCLVILHYGIVADWAQYNCIRKPTVLRKFHFGTGSQWPSAAWGKEGLLHHHHHHYHHHQPEEEDDDMGLHHQLFILREGVKKKIDFF